MTDFDDALDLDDESAPSEEHTPYSFTVASNESGNRLDVFLAAHLSTVSRSQAQRLVDSGDVRVNGAIAKASAKLSSGDQVEAVLSAPKESHISGEDIPIDVVYEDEGLLVVNKARGMVVHPANGSENGTLVNALLGRGTQWSGIGGVSRPGIVHRLDKDTTGLLVVAKTDVVHRALQTQIQTRAAKRRYLALSWGNPPFEEAEIDLPIGRHPTDRTRMAVTDPKSRVPARAAQTHVQVRERFTQGINTRGAFTLFECSLQTGRTHQIRVHLSYAGYPIVGDPVYGGVRKITNEIARPPQATQLADLINALHGQALHAYSLSFTHPATGATLSFTAPPPPELQNLLDFLRALAPP